MPVGVVAGRRRRRRRRPCLVLKMRVRVRAYQPAERVREGGSYRLLSVYMHYMPSPHIPATVQATGAHGTRSKSKRCSPRPIFRAHLAAAACRVCRCMRAQHWIKSHTDDARVSTRCRAAWSVRMRGCGGLRACKRSAGQLELETGIVSGNRGDRIPGNRGVRRPLRRLLRLPQPLTQRC